MNNNLKGRNTRNDIDVGDKFLILVTDFSVDEILSPRIQNCHQHHSHEII